jgi:hypothetical protein
VVLLGVKSILFHNLSMITPESHISLNKNRALADTGNRDLSDNNSVSCARISGQDYWLLSVGPFHTLISP